MTKKLFILCMAFVWAATMTAQNIAVVSPNGDTSLFTTLQEAVDGAEDGSVVYLPGRKVNLNDGTADNIHITKKLSIIGIGHKSESPDGITFIDGCVYFDEGSSGSSLMGCYLDDNVYIHSEVNDITIKHNRIYIIYTGGKRTFINENFISLIYGYQISSNPTIYSSDIIVSHNIINSVQAIYDGDISNNIFYNVNNTSISGCYRSSITDNILLGSMNSCSDNYLSGNMSKNDLGEDCINIGNVDWGSVFVNYKSSHAYTSDWHFQDEYKQYEDQVGIYAGSGFSDKQLAPVPYIVSKRVDDQTDAQGKLSIKVRVNAGDAE